MEEREGGFFPPPVSSSLSDELREAEQGQRNARREREMVEVEELDRKRVIERGRQIAWRGQREGQRVIFQIQIPVVRVDWSENVINER